MNDFEMEFGVFVFRYQRSKRGRGEASPKEIVKGLKAILKNWQFFYGEDGEKLPKFCPVDGYYCECHK